MTKKSNHKPVTKGRVKVPVIMQLEAMECGAASLCMILAYYDKWVPLEEIRKNCGISRDGSNMANIMKAAGLYGMVARSYSLSTEKLKESGVFPCILYWGFNHFVVCDGFRGDEVYLNENCTTSLIRIAAA